MAMSDKEFLDFIVKAIVAHPEDVKSERTIESFISLCRKESENNYAYDKCEIARFIAGTEIK